MCVAMSDSVETVVDVAVVTVAMAIAVVLVSVVVAGCRRVESDEPCRSPKWHVPRNPKMSLDPSLATLRAMISRRKKMMTMTTTMMKELLQKKSCHDQHGHYQYHHRFLVVPW